MKRLGLVLALTATALFSINSAPAIASGDRYQNLQATVKFRILKPANTLGLKPLNFEVRPCRLFPKRDKYLLAGFGSADLGIALVETAATFNCTGVDHPQLLGTTKINGVTANIGIYCSSSKCTSASFAQHGGEITFTLPAKTPYGSTYIRLGTQGGFTLKQLIAFAMSLKPIVK
jgi:hypothetical protein